MEYIILGTHSSFIVEGIGLGKTMAKISIIIPVYNVEKYLRRCMDSILQQTFQDFELVLVNDGSVDNSGAICEEYALADKRIHVIHQQNSGQARARNVGLDYVAQTDSQWITFIDSDDWIKGEYLEILYDIACKNNADIGACDFHYTLREWDSSADIGTVTVYDAEGFWVHQRRSNINPSCKLFKKEIWEKIRFPEGRIYEDTAIMAEVIFSARSLAFIQRRLYFYFYNENSTMHRKWDIKSLQQIDALNDQLVFFKKIKKKRLQRYVYAELSSCYYRNILNALEVPQQKEYEKAIRQLRRGLAKLLRRKYWIVPIRHYEERYLAAWPNKQRRIRFFKRVDSKLARIFKWDE